MSLGTWGLEPCQGDLEPPASPGRPCPGATLQPARLGTPEEGRASPQPAPQGALGSGSALRLKDCSPSTPHPLVPELPGRAPAPILRPPAHGSGPLHIADIFWLTKTLGLPLGDEASLSSAPEAGRGLSAVFHGEDASCVLQGGEARRAGGCHFSVSLPRPLHSCIPSSGFTYCYQLRPTKNEGWGLPYACICPQMDVLPWSPWVL